MNCQEDATLTCEILTDEYSFPSPSMQRKRAVAAPLMTTQPGSTGWISSRPAVQCSSELKIAPSHLQSLLWFIDNLCFKMLHLLYRVWSAEPWICPSPLISRCSPGLAAYRCLSRTTCPQPWAMWGPWSDRGKETTPIEKKILATDTATMISSNMIHQILCNLSAAAPPSWSCAETWSQPSLLYVVLISCR